MTKKVLCTGPISVSVLVVGERTTLIIEDSNTIRFDCRTDMVRDVLTGSPMQVSSPGGFCLIELRGTTVRVEYGVTGEPRQTCDFSAETLRHVLDSSSV